MARPRHQRGYIAEVGKHVKKWKGNWFVRIPDGEGGETRRHRSRILGRKPSRSEVLLSAADAALPEMSRAEAQAELDRIIRVEVGGVDARRDGSKKFGEFWRERWLPLHKGSWRRNTVQTNLTIIENHIDPRWGGMRLDAIDAPAAASWLGALAEKYSPSFCHKARTYLRAIVSEAVEQDYLAKDPLRRLKKPQTKKRTDRSYLTEAAVWLLRDQIRGVRDQLILDILLATGMRPGELFALRWSDVQERSLYIDEGFTNGRLEEPKTPSSIAAVAVPAEIMDRIGTYRQAANRTDPQDFVFPTEAGTPVDSANWRNRVLQPAAKRAGLRVNFQVLRRTMATLSINDGVPVKAVQAQLRHSSADTTMNVYAQVVSAAQGAAAERIFSLMKRKTVIAPAHGIAVGTPQDANGAIKVEQPSNAGAQAPNEDLVPRRKKPAQASTIVNDGIGQPGVGGGRPVGRSA